MIAVMSITIVGVVAWRPQALADPTLPPMTLIIVGLNGTSIVLHENDVGNLVPYSAYGGTKNSIGKLANFGNYTGVPMTTLADLVGGIINGYNVKIIAGDNYTTTMPYEALNGTGLNTYDSTGQAVQHNQTLTPMLSYYCNSSLLPSGGPLRLTIVGPEGLYTDSSLWVKNVTRLEVHPNLQPMNLTLVALNGTQITINETTIAGLPALRGVGATRNKLGNVGNLGNYTGPSINTFLNLIGGISSNNALRVTAADNYSKTLSYDMVNGAFQTYDPSTGQPVQHNEPLTPILAYHFNDANLSPTDNGPLRLAIIGPEGLATFSQYWVQQVVKLEIRYIDDVAITNATPSKTVVGQGYACNLTATAANLGGYDETFNVTVYANQTVIGTQTVTLSSGNSTSITCTWNTTGFAMGNYTISAYASPVYGETNTTNNSLIDGPVLVTIPGDVNGDHKVRVDDILLIALAFGSNQGDLRYSPNLDINGDGKVRVDDILTAAQHFGVGPW
jgi:hypothetical protein